MQQNIAPLQSMGICWKSQGKGKEVWTAAAILVEPPEEKAENQRKGQPQAKSGISARKHDTRYVSFGTRMR
jgi:hypothetical protein